MTTISMPTVCRADLKLPELLARTVTLFVGLTFLVAGFLKASDATQLRKVLEFDGFGTTTAVLLWAIPVWEIFIGAGLMLNLQRNWFACLAFATLVIFTAQLGYLALNTNAPDCGCLGRLMKYQDAQRSNLFGICRNVVMMTGVGCAIATYRLRRLR
jgi:uncharacterized membrane protein YphA (DoxX/SURF4 family)